MNDSGNGGCNAQGRCGAPLPIPVTFDGEIVWFQNSPHSGFGISRARLIALLEDSAKVDYPLTSNMAVWTQGAHRNPTT